MACRVWTGVVWGLGLLALTPAAHVRAEGYQYPPQVHGESVAQLAVHVETSDVPAKGVVTLTVTVAGGANLEVAKTRLDDPTDAWQVREESSTIVDSGRTVIQRFHLRQAKPGAQQLPAVTVRFREGPEAAWREAEWTNILQDARPAPPPESVALEATSRRGWLWGAAGLIGCAIAAWCWLRRHPRPVPAPSPAACAFRELAEAEQADFGPAELHRRLSEIVRRYLAERWQLPALRQTSEELLKAHGSQLPLAIRGVVAEFLERCDLAKFAPAWPANKNGVERPSTVALARSILEACEKEQSTGRPDTSPKR